MKWFKHQSTSRNDEKIARLEDKCGLEGYGFYFKILEIVAESVDQSNKCEVTYSMSRWGRQTNVSTKKWLFLSQCCSDVGLMIVCRCNDDITVKIPNLLKYRDNHTKNLQAACKQDKEEDIDKEENKIKDNKKEINKEKREPKTPAPTEDEKPGNKPASRAKKTKTLIPDNFSITDPVASWYSKQGYVEEIELHFESFRNKSIAKGYEYADWDAAFRSAITDDWAGVRRKTPDWGNKPPQQVPIQQAKLRVI